MKFGFGNGSHLLCCRFWDELYVDYERLLWKKVKNRNCHTAMGCLLYKTCKRGTNFKGDVISIFEKQVWITFKMKES